MYHHKRPIFFYGIVFEHFEEREVNKRKVGSDVRLHRHFERH